MDPKNLMLLYLFLGTSIVNVTVARPTAGGYNSLYGPEDKVFLLNSTNINQLVFNSNQAWFIEFFAHWCGHCIRFAPVYKLLAEDLHDWRKVLVVAAINCADEINTEVCSEFQISGYPTLRFIPPSSPPAVIHDNNITLPNKGITIQKGDGSISRLKTTLIDQLSSHFPTYLGFSNNNETSTDPLQQLWLSDELHYNTTPTSLVIIFENSTSYIGKELALRLSLYEQIKVYRFEHQNAIYQKLVEVSKRPVWPAVGYLGRNDTLKAVTWNGTVDTILRNVLELAGIERDDAAVIIKPTVLPHTANVTNVTDVVSLDDLLHTVRDSLHTEIPLVRVLEGDKLAALKKYLTAVAKYFPADRPDISEFFNELNQWVATKDRIRASAYKNQLRQLENRYSPWQGVNLTAWDDCQATVRGRRGYTCGLWRLFHTLTIKAVEKNATEGVLPVVHDYVKEFFGCIDCKTHFMAMVTRDGILSQNSPVVQALWLWRAHNEVNLRTRGTPSEDPGYPKENYPNKRLCPQCYDSNGHFIEPQVLEYLKRVYARPRRSKKPVDETGGTATTGSRFRDLAISFMSFFI